MQVETSEKIRNIASALNASLVSFTILLGGVWAYYKFDALDEITKSRAAIAQLELQNKESERQLRKRPAIHVSVAASQESSIDSPGYYVLVEVSMRNRGDKTIQIEYSADSFAIGAVSFDQDGHAVFGPRSAFSMPSSDDPSVRLNGLVLRAGDVETPSTVVRVSDPGLYFVTFYSEVPEEEGKQTIEDHGEPEASTFRGYRWGGSKFVVVE